MLLHEFDPSSRAIFNPDTIHVPIPGMPKICVSCFSRVTMARMVESLHAEEIAHTKCANAVFPVYKAVYRGVEMALTIALVGAAGCVGNIEDLFAMGVETVVLFGNCGVLDQAIEDCSIILPTSALRDEGTSYHYAPPSDEIPVNVHYGQLFEDMLQACGLHYTKGKTWTTDAIYRETREKAARRRAAGCVCVEMECSAVAALCQFRQKEALQFFYAGDNLDAETWDPRSLSADTKVEEKDKIALLALEAAWRIHERKN